MMLFSLPIILVDVVVVIIALQKVKYNPLYNFIVLSFAFEKKLFFQKRKYSIHLSIVTRLR